MFHRVHSAVPLDDHRGLCQMFHYCRVSMLKESFDECKDNLLASVSDKVYLRINFRMVDGGGRNNSLQIAGKAYTAKIGQAQLQFQILL